jgi:hypothetical protein
MATVAYPHIDCTRDGGPFVAGTQTKVVEVVLDRLAYHWDADEIHRQHPHLSLSQIYSAQGPFLVSLLLSGILSLRSTSRYLHVTPQALRAPPSPLDTLPLEQP